MTGSADRRALLLAALAVGGASGLAETLAPALAGAAAGGAASSTTGAVGVPPEHFGADGSVAGDSAGLRAALASDAAAIVLAPRTYLLDAAGLQRLALTGKEMRGVRGRTTIRLVAPPGGDMVSAIDASDFAVRGITFDGGGLIAGPGLGAYPGFRPCLLLERCRRFAVTGCGFVGFDTGGLLVNIASEATLADNRVERGRSAPTPNYGIAVLGGGRAVTVRDNSALACNIAVDVRDSAITGNDVAGWGFSAGINVAEDVGNARDLLIAFNRCHDSATVPDRDGFYLDGIECWAPGSILVANQCRRSIGNGISFGAADTIVAANQCHDNGTLLGGKPVGWGIRALADKEDASRSLVVANRCGDTRDGTGKRQAYGYGETSTGLAGIELWANNFDGNALGALDLRSSATRVDGVRTGAFVPIGSGPDFAKASGSYSIDAASTTISVDVTLPPTRDGAAFGIGGLPTSPSHHAVLLPAIAPIDGLRLVAAPGSRTLNADSGGRRVTNADLSGRRIVASGSYRS